MEYLLVIYMLFKKNSKMNIVHIIIFVDKYIVCNTVRFSNYKYTMVRSRGAVYAAVVQIICE